MMKEFRSEVYLYELDRCPQKLKLKRRRVTKSRSFKLLFVSTDEKRIATGVR